MPGHSKYTFLESLLFPKTSIDEQKLQQCLKGKTVLITGASYGIGEAIAYRLSQTGGRLILVARTEERLAAVKKKIEDTGGSATIFPTDLTKPEQVTHLSAQLQSLSNGVDIVKTIKYSILRTFIIVYALGYHTDTNISVCN